MTTLSLPPDLSARFTAACQSHNREPQARLVLIVEAYIRQAAEFARVKARAERQAAAVAEMERARHGTANM